MAMKISINTVEFKGELKAMDKNLLYVNDGAVALGATESVQVREARLLEYVRHKQEAVDCFRSYIKLVEKDLKVLSEIHGNIIERDKRTTK